MPIHNRVAGSGTIADTLLVIGVHREELAFGERVASLLAEGEGLPGLDLLRIPDGISGQHPRWDQRLHYELLHAALYQQIGETVGQHKLLIDLHRGEDDQGPCADVISGSDQLLHCIGTSAIGSGRGSAFAHDRVRTVRLTRDGLPAADRCTAARTVIPAAVWDSPHFTFVGLEVYLPTSGAGRPQDWAFTARLVEQVIRCARSSNKDAGVR